MSINTTIANVIEFLERCFAHTNKIANETYELNFDIKYELPEVETAELVELSIELPEICCELEEVTFALAA